MELKTEQQQIFQQFKKISVRPSLFLLKVGGGIRTMDTVELYLEKIGIDRVILGTAAIENPEFLKTALKKYGAKRIVVGVDIKDGFVSTSGWLVNTQIYYLDFLQELKKMGVQYIVCTDISKDGTLQGPSFPIYQKIKDTTSLTLHRFWRCKRS